MLKQSPINKQRQTRVRCAILLVASTVALQGCASFSGKPPLPKRASLERMPRPAATTDYAALVANAEVLYFPRERTGSSSRSDPAALLLDALQGGGVPFAIGWDMIDASQQAVLDQLAVAPPEEREQLIAQLEFHGTGRAREYGRMIMREPRFAAVRHMALRLPAPLQAKLSTGEPLAPDEQRQLPGGFRVAAGSLEAYTQRLSTAERADPAALAGAYRARLAGQQYAAELIVQHFRAVGGGGKLLVFVQASDLDSVPGFVAQKLQLRQVVLDSRVAPQPRLLTGPDGDRGRDVQVVDRSPRAAGE